MKFLISLKTGLTYYTDCLKDYHTKEGFITKEDLLSGQINAKSSKGVDFLIFDCNNYDLSKNIKRGPQIILAKDLGYIASRGGLDKNYTILEAGSGSGAATIFFSKLCKKVISYEINEKHYEITKKNIELLGLDNVDLNYGDLAQNISKINEYDLLFLDMPEPLQIIKSGYLGLRKGSYIVVYLPSISQIVELVSYIISDVNDLYVEEVSEVILRNWKINSRVSRPEHRKETDHTAFLVFIRKG